MRPYDLKVYVYQWPKGANRGQEDLDEYMVALMLLQSLTNVDKTNLLVIAFHKAGCHIVSLKLTLMTKGQNCEKHCTLKIPISMRFLWK